MPQYRCNICFEERIFSSFSGAEEEESITSDEDVPFRDDINDQSYDPKAQRYACMKRFNNNAKIFFLFFFFYVAVVHSREVPKPKRRAPPRQKDKKEKEKTPKKETEVAEIKVEGLENLKSVEDEVKLEEEIVEDPDGPRK